MFGPLSRLPFLLAVALVAAALGDAFVETVSNSGLVGAGYADDNHASVLPAFLLGVIAALEAARRRCCALLRRGERRAEADQTLALMRRYRDVSPLRDLPLVLTLQFALLFVMESAEQVAFGGKLLGGTAWLGGPIAFSLIAHATLGAGCMLLLRWFVRRVPGAVATFVRDALDYLAYVLIAAARSASCIRTARRDERPRHWAQAPHSRRIRDRAPPLRSCAST